MENKGIVYGVLTVVVLAAAFGGGYWYMQNRNTSAPQNSGKIIFSITDAAASMNGVTSVQMTASNVQLHSTAQGWVSVPGGPKQYDLLALNASGKVVFQASADVAADTYNQIRMHIDNVTVVKNGVSTQATLPMQDMTVNGNVVVRSGGTASVKTDFLADKSLHLTSQGQFIFAPVVTLETRNNANVQVASDGGVTIVGGNIDSSLNVGMDIDGTMKTDFILDATAGVLINNGVIQLQGNSGATTNAGAGAPINTNLNGQVNTNVNVGGY